MTHSKRIDLYSAIDASPTNVLCGRCDVQKRLAIMSSHDYAANKNLVGCDADDDRAPCWRAIQLDGQVAPQNRIHHRQRRSASLSGLGREGRDDAISTRSRRYAAYLR